MSETCDVGSASHFPPEIWLNSWSIIPTFTIKSGRGMEGIIFCSERAVPNSLPHKTRQDIGCFQSQERDRGSEIILHGGWGGMRQMEWKETQILNTEKSGRMSYSVWNFTSCSWLRPLLLLPSARELIVQALNSEIGCAKHPIQQSWLSLLVESKPYEAHAIATPAILLIATLCPVSS